MMYPKNIHRRARSWIVALLLGAALPSAQAAGPSLVVLGRSIKPVEAAPAIGPANPHKPYISRAILKPGESAATMKFEVALKMRNVAELQDRVAKGNPATPTEMAAKYDPLPADYQAVIDWLTSQGFTITQRDSSHMLVFASGTVGQIQQAMQVSFARVTLEGKEYTSAVTDPSVPASISPLLLGINGLQPHLHAHKHIIRPNATSGSTTYTPAQIAQAYQATALYNTNINGAGQAIAIVIDTFPQTSDLIAFWNGYGINQSMNNVTFIQAVPGTLAAVSGEETLDVEWSSSIAPGAKVRVYAATDLGNVDLDTAYSQVYNDVVNHPEYNIHQMSMSYGEGESGTTPSQMATDDSLFLKLTNAGVNCFASAGDGGATPDDNGGETGNLEPETPASDPNVIGVGGTSLETNVNPTAATEVVWNDGASGGATGGGISTNNDAVNYPQLLRPSWQKGTGITSGTRRLVPDIACSSDPNYGAAYYYTDPTNGLEVAIGGTSWACPTCAAFCALINQARANVGLAAVGQLGPLIYPLLGTKNFRDITSGNNATATSGSTNGKLNYTAGAGYDECTGIGVPLVQTLAQTLAGTQTLLGVGLSSTFVTINQGQNATITAAASGSPLSYQWQRMPVGTTTWFNLGDNGVYSGTATTALKVSNATPAMSGDQFQCLVTYGDANTLTSTQPTTLIVETPWVVSTLAGQAGTTGHTNGTGTAAQFDYPTGIALDSLGNLYIADLDNNQIRKVTPAGVVTTPYGNTAGTAGNTSGTGNDGPGTTAYFVSPRDIASDGSGHLFVSDEGSNQIREINTTTNAVTTITTSISPALNGPKGLAVDSSGNVYVADSLNNVIRKLTPMTNGAITTWTASIFAGSSSFKAGYADGAATTHALFNEPLGLAVDSSGNVYVTEYNNVVVRKISGGIVSTLAGQSGITGCQDGPGSQALFNVPRGIMVDGSGNLYVTDSFAPVTTPPPDYAGNNLLRMITPAGVVSTLAGLPGPGGSTNATGSAALFYNPCGLAMNSSGTLYIADASNNTIRSAVAEPVVTLSATQPNASVAGPIAGQFTVTRTGSTLASLTLGYSLTGSTAVSGTDYTALTGSVTIPAGASSATITVNPLSDPQATTNRTVQVTLTSSSVTSVLDPNPEIVTITELTSFSAWQTLKGITSGPTAVPFNDGVPNLLKYLYDINPAQPMTAADRAALPVFAVSGGDLTLTFREYSLETGLNLVVQTSTDLINWSPASTAGSYTLQPTGAIDSNTHDPYMKIDFKPTSALPRQFLRLQVILP